MKKKSVERIIENAQYGYLTKDEYRDFQKKLKSDPILVEKACSLLLEEGIEDFESVTLKQVVLPEPPPGQDCEP